MKIWLDGGLQDLESARVSVLDHGLTVGDGIFETVKAVDGRPFALTRHLDRLTRSARGLGLPDPTWTRSGGPAPPCWRRSRCRSAAAHHVHRRLRPLGSDRGDQGPTLVVAVGATKRRPDATAVITVPWTRNERGALAGLKTTSYAENVVALARASNRAPPRRCSPTRSGSSAKAPGRTSSWSSTARSTPRRSPPAVSRASPARSPSIGRRAKETDLTLDVLERADEVFLTSTLRDVQAVRRVDGRELPGAPGPVTAKAMRIFDERAGNDLDP